jgi:hypothetical protein
MIHQEAAPNWASKEIERIRGQISRIIPRRERKAEAEAIVAAIKAHPKGAALAKHPDLYDAVWEALGIANAVQRDKERDPSLMTASPAIQASWHIFEDLGLPIPEPDF